MSRFTDEALDRYIEQAADLRHAYNHDPGRHAAFEVFRCALDAAYRAMQHEMVDPEVGIRVINRMVWGDPVGVTDQHAADREAFRVLLDSVAT